MAAFNELIHQTVRLRIMSALASLSEDAKVDFTYLKKLLALSDGNLGAHLLKLEEAAYLTQEKTFVDRKPRTYLQLTQEGRKAFLEHVAALRELLGEE
ncbi:MAG: transcriptional regulator [Firmicutes bacterium]|nr:transcriptional regulator [Bacillota bacterium]